MYCGVLNMAEEGKENTGVSTTNVPKPSKEPKMSIGDLLIAHTNIVLGASIIKTMSDTGEMWVYNNEGYYTKNGEQLILRYCADNSDINTVSMKNNIIMNIKGRTMINREDFIEPPGCINLINGVLHLKDRTLHPHDSKYNFKGRMAVEYKPHAICPNWRKMLSDAITEDDIITLQDWFAYHYERLQPLEVAMLLHGAEQSGKSKILEILERFISEVYVSHHSLQEICNPESHSLDNMYGKRANIHADLGNQKIKDVSGFKLVTGGDRVTANPKFKNPFEYHPDAKLSFGCNNLPPLSMNIEEDAAWWRRWLLIEFTKTITNPDPNFLKTHIISEMSGILNWTLEGYDRIKKNGRITYNKESYVIWQEAMQKTNKLLDFFHDYFIQDNEGFVSKDNVRLLYKNYCAKNGEPQLSETKFGIYFKRPEIGALDGTKYMPNNKAVIGQVRVWYGISVNLTPSGQKLSNKTAAEIKGPVSLLL